MDNNEEIEVKSEDLSEESKPAKKPAKAKQTIRSLIMLILLCVFVYNGYNVYTEYRDAKTQAQIQERMQLYSPLLPNAPIERYDEAGEYISPIYFEELWTENEDVVGWITVPDTNIDYPIVQYDDNEYYLHNDLYGKRTSGGSIYLDCDADPNFRGWNHPIYGHHMRNGSMFKDVVKFKDKEFFDSHRYFTIYTPDREIKLKTFACYYAGADGVVRKTVFNGQDSFDAWVADRVAPCAFGEVPDVSLDSVFVLVTCSYEVRDARTMLFAAEVDENDNWVGFDEEHVRYRLQKAIAEKRTEEP